MGESEPSDELRSEYDFAALRSRGRGSHAERYLHGTNVVRLDADVQKAFPTSESVNSALRGLIQQADSRG
jgi:hypothetical protein